MIVADTDVLIDALRGREPASSRLSAGLRGGTIATTAISAFELLSGARTPAEVEVIEALLAALPILPFDERASKAAGSSRRELEAKGRTIGMGDYLIAGICLSRAAPLLTRNRKHFERIAELSLDSL
jgi:predicted nucleic acid-binding protein